MYSPVETDDVETSNVEADNKENIKGKMEKGGFYIMSKTIIKPYAQELEKGYDLRRAMEEASRCLLPESVKFNSL